MKKFLSLYVSRKNRLIIRHAMRGRLRIESAFVLHSKGRAIALEKWLSRQAQIEQVIIDSQRGNIILFYHPEITDADTIVRLVRQALRLYYNHLRFVKQLEICHCMRGRLRLKSAFIQSVRKQALILGEWLSEQPHIHQVDISPEDGNIIVYYSPGAVNIDRLLVLIQELLEALFLETLSQGSLPETFTRPAARSFTKKLIGLGALTVFSGYVFIKEVVLGNPLPQGPFSAIAIVSILGAIPLFRHALEDLRQGKYISLFTFLSSACLLAIMMGQAAAALEIVWVFRVSMLLEEYIAEKSRRAITETFQVAGKTTYILVDDVEVETAVENVLPGDTVAVRTGEKIPVDGTIIAGEAFVDEAHISGKATAEFRHAGKTVFAGTFVQQGRLFIKALKVGSQTYLARTLRAVEESLANRAPVEKQADILAARLSKLGTLIAIGTFIVTGDLYRTVTVLIVMSCPCATVLAASTAISAAIVNAAKKQILIKGGLSLEMAGKADVVCFDKTGTITEDVSGVIDVFPRAPGQKSSDIVALAAGAERSQIHPISRALQEAAAAYGTIPQADTTPESVIGRGVKATIGGDIVLVGNTRFMQEEGVKTNYYKHKASQFSGLGYTIIYVAKNNKLQGMLTLGNPMRPSAEDVLEWLRQDGVAEIFLVTGDTDPVAAIIADKLGFDDYRAALLPEEKAAYIRELEKEGKGVIMVGDGINDALALSEARIGIAMGAGGAEAAIETADIAVADSRLERLVTLRQLSHRALVHIEQNYFFAVSTTMLGILLGAAGWITPVGAGAIHIFHTLGIMANSSRLLSWKAPGLEKPGT